MRLTLSQFFKFIFYLPLNSWEWFRPSVEGNDQKASIRRISAISLLVQGLVWVIALSYRLLHYPTAVIPMAAVWLLVVLLTAALLLFGIITAQQVVEALHNVNNFPAAAAAESTPTPPNEQPYGNPSDNPLD